MQGAHLEDDCSWTFNVCARDQRFSRRLSTEHRAEYIPSSVMIPQRRFATLLEQARAYQQSRCLYHNLSPTNRSWSLYTDHLCERNAFPRVSTAILQVHTDEVWNLEWSHSGKYLATASKDKSAIIWRVEVRTHKSLVDVSSSQWIVWVIDTVSLRSLTRMPLQERTHKSSFCEIIHTQLAV